MESEAVKLHDIDEQASSNFSSSVDEEGEDEII
jgi:hypothetical protein